MTVGADGKSVIDHSATLTTRETVLPLKDVVNSTYKLNAKTCGVCECLNDFAHSVAF